MSLEFKCVWLGRWVGNRGRDYALGSPMFFVLHKGPSDAYSRCIIDVAYLNFIKRSCGLHGSVLVR